MTGKESATITTAPERAVRPYIKADELPALIAAIPDAPDDAEARIIESILNASSAQEIDAPWRSGSLVKYRDQTLTITELSKVPSDKDPVVGYFVVLRGTVRGTGEPFTASTSSHAILAQLVRIWLAEALPIDVIPRVAERPSRNGFHPMHLDLRENG